MTAGRGGAQRVGEKSYAGTGPRGARHRVRRGAVADAPRQWRETARRASRPRETPVQRGARERTVVSRRRTGGRRQRRCGATSAWYGRALS